MEFILVLYIYAGMLARGDSVAMQAIYGFKTQQECEAAGKASNGLVSGSTKELRYVCIPRKA